MKYGLSIITFLLIIGIAGLSMFYNQGLYDQHLSAVHEDPSQASQISTRLINYFQAPGYVPPDIEKFTEQENEHLLDVKKRMCFIWYLVPVLLLLLLLMLHKKDAPVNLTLGAAAALILVQVSALIPFNLLFLIFHLVLFPSGNWMFPQSSALILTYPRPLWILMAGSAAYRIIALSLLTIIIAFLINRLTKNTTSIRKV